MKIVISIGGSVLVPSLNSETFKNFASVLKELLKDHTVFVVTGGGKAARTYIGLARELGADEATCDLIGIQITRLNARLLIESLGDDAYHKPPFDFEEAKSVSSEGKIVVVGGIVPAQSTDAVAAILAEYVHADMLIIASSVDGLYSADPKKDKTARKIERIAPKQFVDIILKTEMIADANSPIDLLAAKIIERSNIKTILLDGENPQNIVNAVNGKHKGTMIVPSNDIQEIAKITCQQSKDTPNEEIACYVYNEIRKWQKDDKEQQTHKMEEFIPVLESKISNISAYKSIIDQIEKINNEKIKDNEKPLGSTEMISYFMQSILLSQQKTVHIGDIHVHIGGKLSKEYEKINDKLDNVNEGVIRIEKNTKIIIEKIETSFERIVNDLEKGGVKLNSEEKEELETFAGDLRKANQEQLANFSNELIKFLQNPELKKEIEKTTPETHKSIIRKTFSKIIDISDELGIALCAALPAEKLLPHFEGLMHEISNISEINPAVASALIMLPLIALKLRTMK